MKVLVWNDDDFPGTEKGNVIRELHAVFPTHVEVKMKDSQIWSYHNAVSIDKLYCRKGHKIPEDHIGRENNNVSEGYACACQVCDEDMYLFEVLHNEPEAKDVR